MLKVKNIHFGSSSDSWDPCGKAKPSYVQYNVGPKQLCALAHLECTREAGTMIWIKMVFNSNFAQELIFGNFVFFHKDRYNFL